MISSRPGDRRYFFARRGRHARGALVTGVQTCALPIDALLAFRRHRVQPFEPPAELAEHDLRFEMRQAGAGAGVDAGAEGQMAGVAAAQIEAVRVGELLGIAVGGAEAEADGLTLADRHTPELDVLERVPEGDLLRAVVAHQLGHQCLRGDLAGAKQGVRSEENTSELQSLMRNTYAVFC